MISVGIECISLVRNCAGGVRAAGIDRADPALLFLIFPDNYPVQIFSRARLHAAFSERHFPGDAGDARQGL
jgi:hypothetical protein